MFLFAIQYEYIKDKGEDIMINFGDKVLVTNVKYPTAINLYNGEDNITLFVGKEATVRTIYDKGDPHELFELEFEHWGAQITRERTGYLFSSDELELIMKGDGCYVS